MEPWVIDALAEPMAAAHYFGFSHGGESLMSPLLFTALRAIGHARQGKTGRTDVHLLSNGMLLTAETVDRLVDHGVTSLAVSIDGATAGTNDSLRVGSRLETVLEHVRRAVAVRERGAGDLRVGLSTVVTARNVDELPALAQLAIDLGVDWLKLEELVPATAQAKELMLRRGDARLSARVAAVKERLEAARVVFVDHLADRSECRCQARSSPQALAFREADDFANRARFNPCRMAWEQACVDPDGTVHPVDYHHPALGNLLEASLFDLWNNDMAQRVRREALARTPRSLREQCEEGLDPAE